MLTFTEPSPGPCVYRVGNDVIPSQGTMLTAKIDPWFSKFLWLPMVSTIIDSMMSFEIAGDVAWD